MLILLPLALALLTAAGLFWYARYVEPRRLIVRRCVAEFEDSRLPVDHLTILHASDPHVRQGEWWKARMLAEVARLEPDVTVITGDFIEQDADTDYCVLHVRELGGKFGAFGVLGNHDHFRHEGNLITDVVNAILNVISFDHKRRNDARALVDKLEANNVKVLVNSNHRIPIDGKGLWLIGIDDPVSEQDDLAKAMQGVPEDSFKILLGHSPDCAEAARRANIDLVLAGHTHGGQIRLPLLGAPVKRTRRPIERAAGLTKLGETWLHISGGLGATVPLRFLCPPEVTLIELKRKLHDTVSVNKQNPRGRLERSNCHRGDAKDARVV